MNGDTLTYEGVLTISRCWCGIRHAIPEELAVEHRLTKGHVVYCPLGHAGVAKVHEQREADRLREIVREQRQSLGSTRELLRHEERSHAATKGHLTRTKRRVAAGVCPCCKRSFKDLARHMEGQHPGYAKGGSGS